MKITFMVSRFMVSLTKLASTKLASTKLASDDMARTKGGSVAQRRQRANAQVPIVDDHEEPQEVLVDAPANPQAAGTFSGGLEDLSVLRHFSDHVATCLWRGKNGLGMMKTANQPYLSVHEM
ncbi:hypothetical protein E2542_SST30839 [Spatholobus suberectus]|nr:hypothetical protein E2542_SST30839 [Spatholobus suberectus]